MGRLLRRCWINEPSKLQPNHELHGTNVLADIESEEKVVTIYFLSGLTISQLIERKYLSPGWRQTEKGDKHGCERPNMYSGTVQDSTKI